MSEKNGTKILLAFVAGAAIGAAIGYFMNSDQKEEVMSDLKEGAAKLKQDLEDQITRAKEMVENFTNNLSDTSTEKPA